MYHGAGDPHTARRLPETLPGQGPEATARAALSRVRKLLAAYSPGMPREPSRLTAALETGAEDASLERERSFALGWLRWLADDPAAAEPLLGEAVRRAREADAIEALAEAAYWCARVRVLLARADALADYETLLRGLGGSPQATAWFIDLLWRSGCVDRAEQVWRSLRGNRRVAGCPEGPLLEARPLLRRGEVALAERLLNEAVPTNGVVWVERLLLLAWAAAAQKQYERARALLDEAGAGPYPATALQTWARLIERRSWGETPAVEEAGRIPPALTAFLAGQQARLAGDSEAAGAAYRAALASAAVQPFARYALTCLGQDDAAALLAAQPGLFLAVRCRARLARERFRARQATPAEYLDALQQADAAGNRDAAAEHFHRLAVALQQRQPDREGVRVLTAEGSGAAARNFLRAALELAVYRLSPEDARGLLLEWSRRGDLDEDLRTTVGRQLLRLLLGSGGEDAEVSAAVGRLLPGEPLLADRVPVAGGTRVGAAAGLGRRRGMAAGGAGASGARPVEGAGGGAAGAGGSGARRRRGRRRAARRGGRLARPGRAAGLRAPRRGERRRRSAGPSRLAAGPVALAAAVGPTLPRSGWRGPGEPRRAGGALRQDCATAPRHTSGAVAVAPGGAGPGPR
jgi:hypothetical protein